MCGVVWSAHLMSLTTHVGGDHRVEAEGEHVVLVRGEGKPRCGCEVSSSLSMIIILVTHFPDLSMFSLLTR